MIVGVDQAWHHGRAGEVFDARSFPPAPGSRRRSDRDEAPIANGDGGRRRVVIIDGVDQAIDQDEIRGKEFGTAGIKRS